MMKNITAASIHNHATWLHILIITAISTLVYAKLIHYGFVSYDDNIYIQNPLIAGGLSIASVMHSFTTVINDNWSPITVLSLMFDSQTYGTNSAYGFHLTNILIHIFNSALVYTILRQLKTSSTLALFFAILFSVHPLQVETVAWVSERKGLLSGFFFLSSLSLYFEYRIKHNRLLYIFSIVFFTFGLMAKAVIAPLPIILFLMEWMCLRNRVEAFKTKKIIFDLLPYLIISLAIGIITIVVQNKSGVLSTTGTLSISTRILNALVSIQTYLTQTIYPTGLSVFYPYLKSYPLYLLLIYFLGFITITSCTTYLYVNKKLFMPLLGWLWFLLMLLPVLGLIQTGSHAHADRYMYLPIIGLFFILLELIKFIQRKKILSTTSLRIMFITILMIYGGAAWVQVGVWKNTETLFLHANRVTKNNYIADSSLALYYLDKNENAKAWEYYQLARKAEPKFATLYTAITYKLLQQKKYSAVLLVNKQMVQAGVRKEDGYRIIGQILLNTKKYNKSIKNFQKALNLNPDDYYCLYGIGYAYYKVQKYDAALSYLHRINLGKHKNTELMQLLGDIYMRKGKNKLANYYYSLIDKGK